MNKQNYVVEKLHGNSGKHDLLVATDVGRRKRVLIKRPKAGATDAPRRSELLRRSYAATRGWRHPNVLTPIDCFEDTGVTNVVYPFIEHQAATNFDLDSLNADAPSALADLCSAVEFVHQMGYVHCDIKCGNVLVDLRGVRPRILLTDFDFLTKTGTEAPGEILGSPLHIAPEVLRNEVVLPQSDYYSLGAMMLLNVTRDGDEAKSLLSRLAAGDTPSISLSDLRVRDKYQNMIAAVAALLQPVYYARPQNLSAFLENSGLTQPRPNASHRAFWYFAASKLAHTGMSKSMPAPIERLSHHGIVGVPSEVAAALAIRLGGGNQSGLLMAKTLLRSAQVRNYGTHWQIRLPLGSAMKLVGESGCHRVLVETLEPKRESLLKSLRLRLKTNIDLAPLLRAAGLAAVAEEASAASCDSLASALRHEQAKALWAAGYASEAALLLREIARNGNLAPRRRFEVNMGIADSFAMGGDVQERFTALRLAYRFARANKRSRMRARVIDKQLWMRHSLGHTLRSLTRAKLVRGFTRRSSLHRECALLGNSVACMQWSLGQLRDAIRSVDEALKQLNDPHDEIRIPLHINKALVLVDQGHFELAVASLKEAQQLLERHPNSARQMYLEANLFTCHLQLGNFTEAEGCLARHSALAAQRGDLVALGVNFANGGWLDLRRGRLGDALAKLSQAREYIAEDENPLFAGRIRLHQAAVYGFRGDSSAFSEMLAKAGYRFQRCGAATELLDAAALEATSGSHSEFDVDVKLRDVTRAYLKTGNLLGAAKCVSHLLCRDKSGVAKREVSQNSGLRRYLEVSDALLSKAVFFHLKSIQPKTRSRELYDFSLLKRAFALYLKSGNFQQAYQLANIIADYYERTARLPMAQRFWSEALRIAIITGNLEHQASCREHQKQGAHTVSQTLSGPILLSIAETLNSDRDYKANIEKLLRFAVEQTGAERGVILLRVEGGDGLRAEAAIDCDKESLEDIVALSKSTLRKALEGAQTWIVDDALTDHRTSLFQSVIIHNIVSIAAVPLRHNDDIIGVLYLDHHSIPGVFSAGEGALVQAVANFISVAVSQARRHKAIARRSEELSERQEIRGFGTAFLTSDSSLKQLLAGLPRVAASKAAVLILGESGTGKEIIASLLHQMSAYSEGPLITVNCATLEGNLLESELFGIEKGTASGVNRREGKIQAADGGTLFLDEIGEMPLLTQAKILRVIETRMVEMLGSNRSVPVDTRVIAATNADLHSYLETGKFRRDLYHRLNTITIKLPPLRDRRNDIPLLSQHFLSLFSGKETRNLSPSVLDALIAYSWPGNVRQLRNLMEQLAITTPPGEVDLDLLPPDYVDLGKQPSNSSLRDRLKKFEKSEILRALKRNGGNQTKTSLELGIPISSLQRRMKLLGISRISDT